jgi:hypothetical protein
MRAIRGVGDLAFEWHEWGMLAVHVRRRLTLDEQAATGLVMLDIRGTPEAAARLDAVRKWLPDGYTE